MASPPTRDSQSGVDMRRASCPGFSYFQSRIPQIFNLSPGTPYRIATPAHNLNNDSDAYIVEIKNLISVAKKENLTVIEIMLSLVNTYGLSHICANREFQNFEYLEDRKDEIKLENLYNFPYIDIYFSEEHIEFYFRGTKERSLQFQNLFEYFLSTRNHGIGLRI